MTLPPSRCFPPCDAPFLSYGILEHSEMKAAPAPLEQTFPETLATLAAALVDQDLESSAVAARLRRLLRTDELGIHVDDKCVEKRRCVVTSDQERLYFGPQRGIVSTRLRKELLSLGRTHVHGLFEQFAYFPPALGLHVTVPR